MGNVLGSEKSKTSKHAITASTLQTPPRTPTLTATSAQTLASEIRDIHHALSELPNLAPGDKVNTLLTRLVNVCIVPYSHEFVTYFFGIDRIQVLCEQLRPLCATAEGELEKYWARRMVKESRSTNGKYLSFTCSSKIRREHPSRPKTLLTTPSNTVSDPASPDHLPLSPKLH